MKQNWNPGTLIYPLPAVMVSYGTSVDEYNITTVRWVGTLCTEPPICYISIRPESHSYDIIKRNMEFVINLTNGDLARATDWCGIRSGKHNKKFEAMNLTPGKSKVIKTPIVDESPISIECKVKEIVELGSHHMFIADVVNIQADNKYFEPSTGQFDMQKANLIAYAHGNYYELTKHIGKFGWSVEKKKAKPKSRKKK
ncbi:MAG TPA: flavin reductase family protein [Dysgonamonadaceae bacterium]|nr:flavin reductase family protein [Dysgonamonadaceae bacterium]